MKKLVLSLAVLSVGYIAHAQEDDTTKVNKQKGEPLEGMDCSWWNGGDRRSTPTLAGKYFTPTVMVDASFTHSFNDPIDNTVVGSTVLGRNNEMQVAGVYLGGDFYYKNARAHVVTQYGTRSQLVPRNDYSPYKGQYQLADVYRYLAEANAGYHFNVLHGINVDAGMFNQQPGVGGNITWCPNENIKMLTNNYYGGDAALIPSRKRFHSDNSLLVRYFNRPKSRGISKMAFSLTGDFGSEKGGGVNGFKDGDSIQGPAQYFASVMFYNRIWFAKNHFAWTVGGGYMNNPGRYLVLYPTGQASPLPNPTNPTSTAGAYPYSANPGDKFEGFDYSTNIDWMPNQHLTVRLEYVHRQSSVPYFAGRGGVTSPSGYQTTALTPDWKPDLVKSEDRIIFAVLFRL